MEYVDTINSIIDNTVSEYALQVYNRENLKQIPINDIKFVINDQLFLDVMLMEIRGRTISFASHKKK